MSILDNDHKDKGFVRLVNRITAMLGYMTPQEVVDKLLKEKFEQDDIRFALAAAKIKVEDR